MNEPQPTRPNSARPETADSSGTARSDDSTADKVEPKSASQLSAEEQMALYEKELKESDWGHQPC